MTDPNLPVPAPAPTQVQYPRRAMVRTAFQAAVGLASLIPYVVAEIDVPPAGWLTQVVAVAAGITRVMALPEVSKFLEAHFSWLAAADPTKTPAA